MISELPRSRSMPRADGEDGGDGGDVGVSRREISWRLARLRIVPRDLILPPWVDRVALLFVLAFLLGGIAAAPFTLEEAVQTTLAADAGTLVTDPGRLVPGGAVSATQESVRLAYGSLTRYVSAIGWYAAGGRQAASPIDLAAGRTSVRVPAWDLVVAARIGPALLAMVGVLVLFFLTRRLMGRTAAVAAVLAFGLHPSIALITRQSVDSGITLTLGLSAVLVSIGISTTLAKGADRGIGAWTALAVLIGLTLASGPTAPPYVAGAVAFCGAGLLSRQLHRRAEAMAGRTAEVPTAGAPAGWMAVTALGAVLVMVAVSPALWGWLPERLDTRGEQRGSLIAQRLLPDPGPQDMQASVHAGVGVLTRPFLAPTSPVEGERLAQYERSWWTGLPLGTTNHPRFGWLPGGFAVALGVILTIAAGIGGVALWRRSRRQAVAVYVWALATAGWLVLWPSQLVSDSAPMVVVACVLVGAALPFTLRNTQRWLNRLSERD